LLFYNVKDLERNLAFLKIQLSFNYLGIAKAFRKIDLRPKA